MFNSKIIGLIAAFWLAFCAPALAAWGTATNLGTATNNSNPTVTITGVTVSAGALIVCAASEANQSTSNATMSDGSNVYSKKALAPTISASVEFYFFYSININALSGATLTLTKGNQFDEAIMSCFSITGGSAGAFDNSVFVTGTGSNATPSLTSGTPSQSGELFVAAIITDGGTGFTQDSTHSWATPPVLVNGSGSIIQLAGGNQINAGSGTKIFSPVLGVPANSASMIIGFSITSTSTAAPSRSLLGVGQ